MHIVEGSLFTITTNGLILLLSRSQRFTWSFHAAIEEAGRDFFIACRAQVCSSFSGTAILIFYKRPGPTSKTLMISH